MLIAADVFNRRNALVRIGGLSLGGLTSVSGTSFPSPTSKRNRRSCIFILMQGGPSHHDHWDPQAAGLCRDSWAIRNYLDISYGSTRG